MNLFARRMRKLSRNPVGYLLDSRHAGLRGFGKWLNRREADRYKRLGKGASDRKVTVIMTAYNTGHLVERAVRSVLAQSHENLELMVIDDASDDNTLTILTALAQEDGRMRVFSSANNHGTYWSKNWCLRAATGDFVAFHDSDDYSDPDRLRMQLGALLSNAGTIACTCRWRRVDDSGGTLVVDGAEERMAAISLMIDREAVLHRAGFFDTVRIAADTEFIHRLKHVFGWRGVKHMRQCLYTGLLREGSLTTGADAGFDWREDGNRRDRAVSGDRARYYEAFTQWHDANKGEVDRLFMSFPLSGRAFDASEKMTRNCDDANLESVTEMTSETTQAKS